MAPQTDPRVTFRLRDEDQKILSTLSKKLGVDFSQIFRLSIRALLEKEKAAIQSVRS